MQIDCPKQACFIASLQPKEIVKVLRSFLNFINCVISWGNLRRTGFCAVLANPLISSFYNYFIITIVLNDDLLRLY